MSLGLEYEWVAILDDNTCGECEDLDTQIFSGYSTPDQPHVNCRCELIPIMPDIPEIGISFDEPTPESKSLYSRIANYIKSKFGGIF